jgi:hypothetical protein
MSPVRPFRWLALGAALVTLSTARAAPLWETSRLASLMREDMKAAPQEALDHIATSIRTRLVLTPLTHAVSQVSDLELALRLAVALQMRRLAPDFRPTREALVAERDAAFLLHAIGLRYETVDEVRFAIDGLAEDKTGQGRALVDAVRTLRREGRAWFDAVLGELERMGPLDARSLLQKGKLLLEEGEPLLASAALSEANAKQPSVEAMRATCDALLATGLPEFRAKAEALRDRVVKLEPSQAPLFSGCFAEADDALASRGFHALKAPTVDEVTAQIARDLGAGRHGSVELLAKSLRERAPETALRVLAVLYFRLERWESLRTLFAEASREGRLDAHLEGIRLAAQVGLMTQVHLGAAPHPLIEGDVEAAVRRVPGLVGRGGALILMLARRAGLSQATPVDEAAVAALDREIRAEVGRLLDAEPRSPEALELAVVAMAGIEATAEGLTRVEKRVAKIPAEARPRLDSLRLRVALGEAFRSGDAKAVGLATRAIDSKIKQLENQDEVRAGLVIASVAGQFAELTLSKRAPTEDELNRARERLEAVAWSLDRTTEGGRELEQTRLLTLASLEVLGGRPQDAVMHFSAARSERGGTLAELGGGLAALLVDDGVGAVELCRRVPDGARADLAQLVSACVASGLTKVGEDPTPALRQVLALWDAAGLPRDLGGRPLRPIFTGAFNIGLAVSHDRPVALGLTSRPLLLLLPELVPSRDGLEARLK